MSEAKSSREQPTDGEQSHSHPSEAHEQRLPAEASLPRGSLAYLVLQRHARLAQLNHFEVLDVPEHASAAMIRRAFQQAVLRFHPDGLRGEHVRLRPLAKEIVCRIGLAYRVHEHDASREQYRRSLAEYPHLPAVRSSIPTARPSLPALRLSSIPTARRTRTPNARAASRASCTGASACRCTRSTSATRPPRRRRAARVTSMRPRPRSSSNSS